MSVYWEKVFDSILVNIIKKQRISYYLLITSFMRLTVFNANRLAINFKKSFITLKLKKWINHNTHALFWENPISIKVCTSEDIFFKFTALSTSSQLQNWVVRRLTQAAEQIRTPITNFRKSWVLHYSFCISKRCHFWHTKLIVIKIVTI